MCFHDLSKLSLLSHPLDLGPKGFYVHWSRWFVWQTSTSISHLRMSFILCKKYLFLIHGRPANYTLISILLYSQFKVTIDVNAWFNRRRTKTWAQTNFYKAYKHVSKRDVSPSMQNTCKMHHSDVIFLSLIILAHISKPKSIVYNLNDGTMDRIQRNVTINLTNRCCRHFFLASKYDNDIFVIMTYLVRTPGTWKT